MNPITGKAKLALIAGVLAVTAAAGGAFAWWVTSTSYEREVAQLSGKLNEERAQWEADRRAISDKAQQDTAAALKRQQDAQARADELDKHYSQELANAQKDNDALRDDVAAGNKRVRILAANLETARLTAGQHANGSGTSASGVGDGEGAFLSAEAGRNILDIRAGILRREAKIAYLQDYADHVVKQCKP